MHRVLTIAALTSSLTLFGCATPSPPPSDASSDSSAAATVVAPPSSAEQACLTMIAEQTDNDQVSVLRSRFSEANTEVIVLVGERQAPWRCLVGENDKVVDFMFAGSEGAL